MGSISRHHWAIGLILLAYLGLALTYSIIDPLFEAPDEADHYAFVKHLADGQGLPVQLRHGPKSENHQPPLYYTLGALATFWINSDDFPQLLWRNPYWGYEIGYVGQDNKNQFVHGPQEDPPYTGAVLAAHLVRLVSVALGAVTVFITYMIAREIFPRQAALALGAVAFVAFSPQFLFISSAINNDNAVTTLSSLVILLALRIHNQGITRSNTIALGAALGLALLTKVSAVPLLLIVLFTLVSLSRRVPWRTLWGAGFAVFGLAAAVSGWWFIRNLVLYGDWSALSRMQEAWGRRSPPANLGQLVAEFPNLERSFWANFGWGNVPVSAELYWGITLLTRIAIVGLIILGWRHWKRGILSREARFGVVVLVVWTLLIFIAQANYMRLTPAAGNGRNLFPAIAAIAILIFLGLAQYVPERFWGFLAGTANIGMATFALSALIFYLAPAYAKPQMLPSSALEAIQRPVRVNFANKVQLLGSDISPDSVSPGDTVRVAIYWRGLAPMDKDYSVYIHLTTPEDRIIAQRDTFPGLGTYPTRLWRAGDTFRDTYRVPIPKNAPTPLLLHVRAGLYLLPTMERLPAVEESSGRPLDRPIVGTVWVRRSPLSK
ncbi:MAG: glycosyltransferase family 39 protein [Chloroflexi bacterium]|nr:glycosyltransferase family 39 protein [Chloroflexota bacterium]